MTRSRPHLHRLHLLLLLLAFGGCSDDPPRFGEVHLGASAPRAILSGATAGATPALELAAGCAGVVDPDAPDHVVIIEDQLKLGVSATSTGGPIGLVIEHDGEFYCDSDNNTGHHPHLQITEPGIYGIRIASMAPGEPLPYRLVLAPDGKDEHAAPRAEPDLVAVSVTSDPAGALVRTEGGQVLGTTPALFEVAPDTAGADGAFVFVVESRGRRPETLRGRAAEGSLELHATLGALGPTSHTIGAAEEQPIRDFATAELTAEMGDECVIQDLEVDVSIRHGYIGDLIVTLHAPTGQAVTLSRRQGGTRTSLERTWRASDTRALSRLVGTAGGGTWRMSVRDTAEVDTGTFNSFELRIVCAPAGAQAVAPQPAGGSRRASYGRSTPPTLQVPNIFRGTPTPSQRGASAGVLDPWAP